MSILFNYITCIENPYWEVLTSKRRWWKIKDYNIRIVFLFYINDDFYRIDYNIDDDDVIYTHKKPKVLLSKLGINPDDDTEWLKEQRELLKIFLKLYAIQINKLANNKPTRPKWYKLII